MYYELYHHGIKGMRWGVRRGRTTSGPNDILTTTKSVSKKSTTKPVTKKSVDKGKKIVSKSQDKKVDEITAADYPIALQMAKRWQEQQAMQFYIEWAQNITNN